MITESLENVININICVLLLGDAASCLFG